MKLILFLSFFMVAYIWHLAGTTYTNFQVKQFEVCNKTQRQILYYSHVSKENGKQYLTHNLTFPVPIGDNIAFDCLIQTKTIANVFVELFTIREKSLCKAFNKYLGEFWYDLERHSGITPGVCPMQQGRYHGQKILLRFETITLQTFPFGTLRFTMKGIDNANKNCVWCLFLEVDNPVN